MYICIKIDHETWTLNLIWSSESILKSDFIVQMSLNKALVLVVIFKLSESFRSHLDKMVEGRALGVCHSIQYHWQILKGLHTNTFSKAVRLWVLVDAVWSFCSARAMVSLLCIPCVSFVILIFKKHLNLWEFSFQGDLLSGKLWKLKNHTQTKYRWLCASSHLDFSVASMYCTYFGRLGTEYNTLEVDTMGYLFQVNVYKGELWKPANLGALLTLTGRFEAAEPKSFELLQESAEARWACARCTRALAGIFRYVPYVYGVIRTHIHKKLILDVCGLEWQEWQHHRILKNGQANHRKNLERSHDLSPSGRLARRASHLNLCKIPISSPQSFLCSRKLKMMSGSPGHWLAFFCAPVLMQQVTLLCPDCCYWHFLLHCSNLANLQWWTLWRSEQWQNQPSYCN